MLIFLVALVLFFPTVRLPSGKDTIIPVSYTDEDVNSIRLIEGLFITDALKRGFGIDLRNITYVFTNDPTSNNIAVCYSGLGPKYKFITINKAYWDKYGFADRHLVLFHEFAHCVLGRNHNNDRFTVMQASKIDTKLFLDNYQILMDELFDPKYLNEIYK